MYKIIFRDKKEFMIVDSIPSSINQDDFTIVPVDSYNPDLVYFLNDKNQIETRTRIINDINIDLNQYKTDRKISYDKLNQFELQFNDLENGTNTWQDAINEIKDKYPKPDNVL